MTRQEIIDHVAGIIREQVDGSAVYYTQSPPGSVMVLDYPVELDEKTVVFAAERIADWILTRGVEEVRTNA
jgi:hypothetical protein